MTNSKIISMQSSNQQYGRAARKKSDTAPMVITRLSGWIDIGEIETGNPTWIMPTRTPTQAR